MSYMVNGLDLSQNATRTVSANMPNGPDGVVSRSLSYGGMFTAGTYGQIIPIGEGRRKVAGAVIWASPVIVMTETTSGQYVIETNSETRNVYDRPNYSVTLSGYSGRSDGPFSSQLPPVPTETIITETAVPLPDTVETKFYIHAAWSAGIELGDSVRLLRIWGNGTLIYDATDPAFVTPIEYEAMRFYTGARTQALDPLFAEYEGEDTPRYFEQAVIVFQKLALGPFSDSLPTLEVELVTAVNTEVDQELFNNGLRSPYVHIFNSRSKEYTALIGDDLKTYRWEKDETPVLLRSVELTTDLATYYYPFIPSFNHLIGSVSGGSNFRTIALIDTENGATLDTFGSNGGGTTNGPTGFIFSAYMVAFPAVTTDEDVAYLVFTIGDVFDQYGVLAVMDNNGAYQLAYCGHGSVSNVVIGGLAPGIVREDDETSSVLAAMGANVIEYQVAFDNNDPADSVITSSTMYSGPSQIRGIVSLPEGVFIACSNGTFTLRVYVEQTDTWGSIWTTTNVAATPDLMAFSPHTRSAYGLFRWVAGTKLFECDLGSGNIRELATITDDLSSPQEFQLFETADNSVIVSDNGKTRRYYGGYYNLDGMSVAQFLEDFSEYCGYETVTVDGDIDDVIFGVNIDAGNWTFTSVLQDILKAYRIVKTYGEGSHVLFSRNMTADVRAISATIDESELDYLTHMPNGNDNMAASPVNTTFYRPTDTVTKYRISYYDADYNYARNEVTDSRHEVLESPGVEQTLSLPFVNVVEPMQELVSKILYDEAGAEAQHEARLSSKYIKMEPRDIIQFNLDERTIVCELTSWSFNPDFSIQVRGNNVALERFDVTEAQPVRQPTDIPRSGLVDFWIAEVPYLSAGEAAFHDDGILMHGVIAPLGAYYGGSVEQTVDGVNRYKVIDASNEPITGRLDLMLPTPTGTADNTSVLRVILDRPLADTIAEGDDETWLSGDFAVIVGKKRSDAELIYYHDVEVIDEWTVELTVLARGMRDTGITRLPLDHPIGAKVVFIQDQGVTNWLKDFDEKGLRLDYAGRGFMGAPSADVPSRHQGYAETPFSPLNPVIAAAGGGDYTITWDRQERTSFLDIASGGDPVVPVVDPRDYEVDVLAAPGGAVLRTLTVSGSETVTYTAAQIATDGTDPVAGVTVRLYQVNDLIGRGNSREWTIYG
jgi:hypothetical protein